MTPVAAIDRGLSAGLAAELADDLAATAFTMAKRFAAGATMWSIARPGNRMPCTSRSNSSTR